MKTRQGFVSNSSSSSFILENSKSIAHLTADDWYEMLIDLYPEYQEEVQKHRKYIVRENYADYVHPFAVFDLAIERGQADKILSHLDGWKATRCILRNGELKKVSYCPGARWEKIVNKKEEELCRKYSDNDKYCVGIYNLDTIKDLRDGNCYAYISNGKKCKKVPISAKVRKELLNAFDKTGVCTNRDVLLNERARFAFHFDDNEYYYINGVSDNTASGKWNTEEYTYGRLCEIMAKWLVAHNKVKSTFTYLDLISATLTCVMHEG